MTKPEHKKKAKRLLLAGKRLTSLRAFDWHPKCTRLAVYIHRLIKEGMPIDNVGQPGRYAVYLLKRSKV
jgi:hypothetical protein